MTILGIILLILGFALGLPVLWVIGLVLVVISSLVIVFGATGRKVAGRSHLY